MASDKNAVCAVCSALETPALLAEVAWQKPEVLARIEREHPHWKRTDGGCPGCVQQAASTRRATRIRTRFAMAT